jgi:site-specific DNA-cytosine methylase
VLPSLRTVAYAEIEAFACELLLARMEGGQLDAAPIWSDLKSFPWENFRGMVDILSGGYPCQPFSASGLRKGTGDERHLWPYIAEGIAILRPSFCFFENVEGHITLGLRDVLQQLGELGYRSTWGIFSAAEVGSVHQRRRVFLLANSMCERRQLSIEWEQPAEQMPRSESEAWRAWRTWSVKPTICGGNDGSSNRVDRLRLLGNGVLPACSEKAFRTLWNEL